MPDFRNLRNQSGEKKREPASPRPVVKVESVVEAGEELPEQAETTTREQQAEQATPQKDPISSQHRVASRAVVAPEEKHIVSQVGETPLLNISDLNAFLQALPDEGGELEEGNEKITIYLEPAQLQKLQEIRLHLQGHSGDFPNVQEVIRYMLETVSFDTFGGFDEYVRNRKLQKLLRVEERRLGKMLQRIKSKHRKLTQ